MLTFIVYALACIGAHRIWNFESIFQEARTWLLRYRWAKPLTCQACNALWIAVALLPFLYLANGRWAWPPAILTLSAFAAYALLRGMLWVYKMASHWEVTARKAAGAAVPPSPLAQPHTAAVMRDAVTRVQSFSLPQAPLPASGCRDCETKKAALVTAQSATKAFDRRIVLLTTLSDFAPSYSLTSVICDQARMLADNPRWLVQIWVNEGANLKQLPTDLPGNVEVHRVVPQVPWGNDKIDAEGAVRLEREIRLKLLALGNATVIAHDLIFQSAFVTFAAAIHRLGSMPGFAWLHVCHSAAGNRPAGHALPLPLALRLTLPEGHKLLCLNDAERFHMARYYATDPENVLVCPNARDITAFGTFSAEAAAVVRAGGLHLADIVQVFPLSATRMVDKGVHRVVDIFARLHWLGRTVRLVLVTAHANGDKEKAALAALREYAAERELPQSALVITSELLTETAAHGLPQSAVRDLFSVSNVFVFPTVSEASSLVLAEAALSGCLIVTNASLPALGTIVPNGHAIPMLFGSSREPAVDLGTTRVAADEIVDALHSSAANRAKRHVLRHSSFAAIGDLLRAIVESVPLRGK